MSAWSKSMQILGEHTESDRKQIIDAHPYTGSADFNYKRAHEIISMAVVMVRRARYERRSKRRHTCLSLECAWSCVR